LNGRGIDITHRLHSTESFGRQSEFLKWHLYLGFQLRQRCRQRGAQFLDGGVLFCIL
jgi:hypothetical protein